MDEDRPRLRPLLAALLIPGVVLLAAAAVGIRARLVASGAAGPAPAARSLPGMAFDAARGEVVMFGGRGVSGALGDTWLWDGSSWRQAHPAVSPSPRSGAAMAYDPASKRVLLYGGDGADSDATWAWDGSTWRSLPAAHHPEGAPGTPVAMALDAAHGKVVMVAPDMSPERAPTPVQVAPAPSGAPAQITPVTPPPGEVDVVPPGPVPDTPIAPLPQPGPQIGVPPVVVPPPLPVSLSLSTWVWQGGDWVEQAGPMPDRPPGPLTLDWDAGLQRVVLLDVEPGGCSITVFSRPAGSAAAGWSGYSPLPPAQPTCGPSPTTRHWWWDGQGWRLASPSGRYTARPALSGALLGRAGYGLVTDTQRHVVLLFGGTTGSGFAADTWLWDGSSWSRAQP